MVMEFLPMRLRMQQSSNHADFRKPNSPPNEWVAFREKIAAADGVLFLTPEYNRSIPGVLKNAIDQSLDFHICQLQAD